MERTIRVTGFSELELTPDIIQLTIVLKEYWKEEFEPGKKYEDYNTKVPLSDIEPTMLDTLTTCGIKQEQITVAGIGNFHRQTGKDFLVSKTLLLTVPTFEMVDRVSKEIKEPGIQSMYISGLKHSRMKAFEKSLHIEALKNAQLKAMYLAESLGETCGEVVLISEIVQHFDRPVARNQSLRASSDHGGASATELRKIRLEYSIHAEFAIAK